MAPKIAYDSSSDALLRPAKNAVFFHGWDPADFTRDDHGLLCAEMSRLAYASRDVVRNVLDGIGFTSFEPIGKEGLLEQLKGKGTQGFIAHNPHLDLTVLAFRGTESDKIEDLLLDGRTLQRERPKAKGCFAHEGFAAGWDPVSEDVTRRLAHHRQRQLLVTGHSLGAGIATLAAIDTKPDALITFGCPLVGNSKLATLLAPQTVIRRYVDCCDLVTRIPPEELDGEHVRQLLKELAQLKDHTHFEAFFALKAPQPVKDLIDGARHLLHLDPQFKHVGSACYADRTGKLRPGISDEDLRKDQEAARQAYERTEGSAALRDLADHAPINYVSIFTGRL